MQRSSREDDTYDFLVAPLYNIVMSTIFKLWILWLFLGLFLQIPSLVVIIPT